MNKTLSQLDERRRQLVAQAAAQRTALAHDLAPWRARLALADQGIAVIRHIGRNPAWIAGAALMLAAWRPRLVGKWLQRGWLAWQIEGKLRGCCGSGTAIGPGQSPAPQARQSLPLS